MKPYFQSSDVTIYNADSRDAWRHLPEHSADAIVTSPPYFGLRDYGVDGQVGLENNPQEFIDTLADLLTGYGERVLKPGGSLWLNLGDSYSSGTGEYNVGGNVSQNSANARSKGRPATVGMPTKCLMMIPERVALAMIDRGWILRNRVVWAKPNGMPSSVTDRLATKHEALFHLVRQPRYFYDLDAIREAGTMEKRPQAIRAKELADRAGLTDAHRKAVKACGLASDSSYGKHAYNVTELQGLADEAHKVLGSYLRDWASGGDGAKNPGDVWTIPTQPYPDAHFAVFPPELVRRPILATVPERVCCGCGTPRERLVKTSEPVEHQRPHRNFATKSESEFARDRGGGALPAKQRETVGWSDCGCDAGWTAGTVLDPFFGSGTSAVMARKLGRKAVGVELSPDYCALASKRFQQEVLDLGGAA